MTTQELSKQTVAGLRELRRFFYQHHDKNLAVLGVLNSMIREHAAVAGIDADPDDEEDTGVFRRPTRP